MGTKTLAMVAIFAALLTGCLPQDEIPLTSEATGPYHVGAGDQLRVIVFNQPTLSNVYGVDATGNISLPLVGFIKADDKTTRQVEAAIVARLKDSDLVTDPKVAVEIAAYRPFSILGEVRAPGRFPYAPNMTVESAVALAGGYSIHADKSHLLVRRRIGGEIMTTSISPVSTFLPGDTLVVLERWL